ncbi:AMP-binding protein [Micromonospora sp. NPDC050397]|uniref:AMP-binding protein n=1 Tax=Micromonospora sp. NPDC050397 TaxID=3364279 RepID=UPI00384FAB7A
MPEVAAVPYPAVVDLAGGVRPGEVVALVVPNGPLWLAGYRALLAAGAVPLLLDADVPAPELTRWLALAGGTRTLSPDGGGDGEGEGDGDGDKNRLCLTGPPPADRLHPNGQPEGVAPDTSGSNGESRVLLCTSGTTGAPKVVARSLASLDAEGRRHAAWSGLTRDDTVALPLPMWHAYALGWVHAVDQVGGELVAMAASALGRCQQVIRDGATVLVLVPSVASLLAQRIPPGSAHDHRLRLAMVGAGPVTESLDQRFRAAFGIGLARNYGSTETGALFSGAPGLPEGCVGEPLSGIEAQVVDPHGQPLPAGDVGELRVRVTDLPADKPDGQVRVAHPPGDEPDGNDQAADGGAPRDGWRRMGDLAVFDEHGLRIVGRNSSAIRRGDRWIAPEEIEAVLLRHPAVVDARCVPVPGHGGATSLEAEVVAVRADATDLSDLRAHLAANLSAHKTPQRVRVVGEVVRGASGKRLPPRSYALADSANLVEAAQAYKRSELLFALLRLGVLDLLAAGTADASSIAQALDLDAGACELLLRTAVELGLVQVAAPVAPEQRVDALAEQTRSIVELEAALSRSWVSREKLGDVASVGLRRRAFENAIVDDGFRDLYQRAIHSRAAHRRVRVGLAIGGYRAGDRLLEVTCGPGRYAAACPPDTSRLLRVGWLWTSDGPPVAPPPEPGDRFDLVVVSNAVHLTGPGSDLVDLSSRLAPGGRLLIDDVYLDADGVPTTVRLDWLTHGGLFWPTVGTLTAGLTRAGLATRRVVHTGTPPATLIVAAAEPPESERA